MIVEVCANSLQSAIYAQNAGADRIEICSELAVGGITPSYGLLKKTRSAISIPVHVLIRPRSGGFTYTKDEFEMMKSDIIACKEIGFEGIVSGILTKKHAIDKERTKELIDLAAPMSFTFHRAYDWVSDPLKAMAVLMEIRVDRILTSGQRKTAEQGLELLLELKEIAQGNLSIMPGGGISPENIHRFKKSGFQEIHFSATKKYPFKKVDIPMNSKDLLHEIYYPVSDYQLLTAMINLVK